MIMQLGTVTVVMVSIDTLVKDNIEKLQGPDRAVIEQSETLDRIKEWDGFQFEEFWAALKRRDGYAARATRGSGDRGIDVVAVDRVTSATKRVTLAQTKQYKKTSVRPHHIKEYDYLVNYAHEVEFVTTADCSPSVEDAAEEVGLILVGPNDIYELIKSTNSWGLLAEEPIGTTSKPKTPPTLWVVLGIALGAANAEFDTDKICPISSNVNPAETYTNAIRALFRHGFLTTDDIHKDFYGNFDEPLFVTPTEWDLPRDTVDDENLIPLGDELYINVSTDDPRKLMRRLIAVVKIVEEMRRSLPDQSQHALNFFDGQQTSPSE